ncbi:MAG: outer membrane lipoprotein carrier protein LolA [Bacteroidetes bacterium]|nr:outer membrane lipoprotein carrier protein LolA [Bacteroidota bacterium]
MLILWASLPVHAQDAKAEKIVAATQQKLNQLKSLKAQFSIQIIGRNRKAQTRQKGTIDMKGAQFHITLPEQEIISDGKTVWTVLKEAKEVQVSNSDASDESLSPTKFFTKVYDKHNSYRYLGSRKVAGKTCDIIEMKPQKPGQFTRVELAIDHNHQIAAGTVFQKDGSRYLYEMSAVHLNPSLSESLFRYDSKMHPNMELVDLR